MTHRRIAALLALVAYIPLLWTHPGMIGADTKAYLYLDPGRLLSSAPILWDPNTGMGTVTHQNIGYLLPMGPWFWAFHWAGVPIWVAQRLWTGTLLFAAGAGVVWLLRGLGWRPVASGVAGLAFMLSPYVLEYEARISAILMPWAALPWMVGLTALAVRRGGWRYPALFALVAAVVGGVNASSLLFAGVAPVLWVLLAVGDVGARRALGAAVRIGVLTVLTGLWWMAGLLVQAGYGMDVLRYTETVEVVARTGVASEAVRGLGNWFFYGRDAIGPWVQPAAELTQRPWLIAAGFGVPLLAWIGAAVARWGSKLYFVLLVVAGVVITVGVHPFAHPSLFGSVLKSFATSSTAGLALRSVGRAAPLTALGIAVLAGGLVEAVWDRRPAAASVLAVAGAALAMAAMTPLFIGQFVDDNLQRPSAVPSYWSQVAGHLQADGSATRVLQLPGQDFAHFTWGATLDALLPGLMNRPYVGRELVPIGGAGSADLLRALDQRLQEGVLDPSAVAPVARRMSAGDVVLASDLQWQRYSTPRPLPTWQLFDPAPAGLTPPIGFGPPIIDGAPYDEHALAIPASAPNPPAVAVFGVPGALPILRTESATAPVVLAGDGEGMVDAAAAGLLNGDSPVLYAGTLDAMPGGYQRALAAGAVLVLTDSNRNQAQRWGTTRETYGYTEQAGEQPLVVDESDARLPVFPGVGDSAYTVAEERGVKSVEATSYGNNVTYTPAQRPDRALDGDPGTAWIVGSFGDVIGQALQVTLLHPITTGVVTLQQPFGVGVPAPPGTPARTKAVTPAGTRFITRVTLHFDTGPDVVADLGPASRSTGGQAIRFPARTFTTVRITIDASNLPRVDRVSDNGVGFSEVGIGASPPRVDEVDRLPTDLLSATGSASAFSALTIVLSRQRSDPANPIVPDTETAMARVFTLPTSRTFAVGGTARISALAADPVIDPLLGGLPVSMTNSSGRLPGDLDARSQMAIDGNPATAWSPARGTGQVGSWIRVSVTHPVPLDDFTMLVVADGRHSVPTRLTFQVDGAAPRTVDLPAVSDRATPGATAAVPVSLPGLVATDHVVVTVAGVRKETTSDPISQGQVELPVGIAELGLPGVAQPAPASQVPPACRTDLLTVDRKPFGVMVTGPTTAARTGLTVTACPGESLQLGAGDHVVRTAPGQHTGIDLDRLVLSSPPSPAVTPASGVTPPSPPSPAPSLAVLAQNRTSATVRIAATRAGGPTWLVLGQSLNKGWTASVAGHALGAPTLVDGYANGWLVNLPAGKPVTVNLQWAPQRTVWFGLALSVLAIIGCVVLAARRQPVAAPAGDPPVLMRTSAPTAPWWVPVTAGLLTAVVVSPAAAVIVLLITASASLSRRGRAAVAVASAAALAASAAMVVAGEAHHHYLLVLEWPQHFEPAGHVAFVAVMLLAAVGLLDR